MASILAVSGKRLVGIPSRKLIFDADWHPRAVKDFAFDLGLNHYGTLPATLDDVAVIPAFTTVDWDTRYEFKIGGKMLR